MQDMQDMHASFPLAPPSAALESFDARPVKSADEWNVYFHALPRPHLMQARAYGDAKRAAAGVHVERIIFEQGGMPVALCQVLQVRVVGMAVGARINRGPVFLDENPPQQVRQGVLQLVRRRWRTGRGGPLLIAPALDDSEENRNLMRSLGFRQRKKQGWVSSVIDLSLPEEEIRKRVSASWRNHLKKALNSGLELRVSNSRATLDWMLERHVDNMRAKGFSGPKPALLAALHAAGPEDFLILQAVHKGEALAGMILMRFGCTAEHYVGWFGPAGRKFDCGNFLYWQAMREAKKLGLRWFDLGGYETNDRFGHFKQNMRGIEYRLAGEWIGL